MLAYHKPWLHALEISREAKRWLESKLISAEQYKAVKAAHTTPFYTPNVFVRIGLAIFTAICVSGFVGLFGLLFNSGGDNGISFWFTVMGVGCILALEFLIRSRKLYSAGIDDALLYSSIMLLLGGIFFFLYARDSNISPLGPAIIALPILIAATVRYADRLTAVAAYASALWILCYPMSKGEPMAQALLPFAVMIFSLLFYLIMLRASRNESLSHWNKCFTILEAASLATLYLGGNYLIVRESTLSLLSLVISEGGNIPFAFVFYTLTVCIPVSYVLFGLKRKDSILIRVGLLAAAFSAFTFRYYFSLGHPEIVLTIAGLLLIGLAIMTIRYLNKANNGFTHERLLAKKFENLDAEMLVVSQSFGPSPQQPSQEFKGGDGKFGGGGASEQW